MYHSGKSTLRLSNFKCFQNFLGKNSSHQLDTNIFLGPITNHQSHRTHFQTLPTLDLFLSSAFAHSAGCIWRIFTAHSRLHVHRRHQGLKVVETRPSWVTNGWKKNPAGSSRKPWASQGGAKWEAGRCKSWNFLGEGWVLSMFYR